MPAASLEIKAPKGDQWLHEIKFDSSIIGRTALVSQVEIGAICLLPRAGGSKMATDYYSTLRQAIEDCNANSIDLRKNVYSLARDALHVALKSFPDKTVTEEEVSLNAAIVRVELECSSDSNRDAVYQHPLVRMGAGLLLCIWIGYPAVAPRSLMPDWLLNHAWLLLIWCGLFSFAIFFSLYFLRIYLDELVKKEHSGKDALKIIALEFPILAPVVICVALVPVAGVLHNLANLSGYYNPFNESFGFTGAYFYLLNMACKGVLSEALTWLGLNLPSQLTFDSWEHPFFWALNALFKNLLEFVGIGALIIVLRWLVLRFLRAIRAALRPLSKLWWRYYAWSQRQRQSQLDFMADKLGLFFMSFRLGQRELRYRQQRELFKALLSNPGGFLLKLNKSLGSKS